MKSAREFAWRDMETTYPDFRVVAIEARDREVRARALRDVVILLEFYGEHAIAATLLKEADMLERGE